MIARLILAALLLYALGGMWHTSRTWDQIVAALIATVAWLVMIIAFIVEPMT